MQMCGRSDRDTLLQQFAAGPQGRCLGAGVSLLWSILEGWESHRHIVLSAWRWAAINQSQSTFIS